jgi:exopolysaccharide production protein ExoQ
MPPTIALLLTVVFVAALVRRDFREKPNVTRALWLPLIWTLLIGSRSVAQWLNVFGFHVPGSLEEGTPLDAAVYSSLIIAGLYVLNKRQVSLSEVFRNNGWFMAFLLYCLITILWSDFPFVSFKRWTKALGHPVMALILLTEPDPEESLTRLLKRSAYVLVPFSILLIKYFPAIGRDWDPFTGIASNRGVNISKNGLGGGCMLFGFFFFWHLLKTWKSERGITRRNELLLIGGFLLMIAYLLRKAHCATCSVTLLIAITLTILLGRQWVNKRQVLAYAGSAVVILAVAELMFGIYGHVVNLTGHETTIAGRAELWRKLLAVPINPVFGVGFESFWLGDRLEAFWDTHWWHPTQAHNGYLETYLNLGLVGLMLLLGLIASTFMKIRRELLTDFEWGRFELSLLVTIVLHNWTEATFRGLGLGWFVFHIIALQYPNRRVYVRAATSQEIETQTEVQVAYVTDSVHRG